MAAERKEDVFMARKLAKLSVGIDYSSKGEIPAK